MLPNTSPALTQARSPPAPAVTAFSSLFDSSIMATAIAVAMPGDRPRVPAGFGKYAEALKEFNHVISLHPASVRLARALKDRAWFQATCPDASFRNGQQAIKDAKAACSIMIWKDENTIDTLAAAYAEIGDFDSAAQYAQQALAVKDISSINSKRIQRHLQSFQQHKPIRL